MELLASLIVIVFLYIAYVFVHRRARIPSFPHEEKALSTASESRQLSDEQMCAFKKVEESRDNFFITGKAGTGKSRLLSYLKDHSRKHLVVLAPTGVAAINIHGQTIHSLFHFPTRLIDTQKLSCDERLQEVLRHIETRSE